MTEDVSPAPQPPSRSGSPPYRDLYIYYLQGRPGPGLADVGRDFIGNWEEADCSFLFFSRPAREAVERLVAGDPRLRLLDQFQMTYEQWQGEAFKPFRVGPLVVLPAWEAPPPWVEAGAQPIYLDPGVVFGTGTHATTRDCLSALTLACRGRQGMRALDLGTGTGLLALAAVRLGCRRVLAVDLNPLAVQTARDNVRRNGMQDRVLAVQGRAESFVETAGDLMIANIHYEVMQQLIGAPGFLKQGRFVLSGLLRSEVRDILHRLGHMPVTILNQWERDGTWHTLYGRVEKTAAGSATAE